MGRIVHIEGPGKERNLLCREIVIALNEFIGLSNINSEAKDIAAYIVICLEAINATIEQSVSAWEKRGYWVKSDRFRIEWYWIEQLAPEMKAAVISEDWDVVIRIAGQIGSKLNKVKKPKRIQLNKPWIGAWDKLSIVKKLSRELS